MVKVSNNLNFHSQPQAISLTLCSDSDDEGEDTATSLPKLKAAAAVGPPAQDLGGSKTKYLPPEGDSDDSDDEQEPQAGGKGAGLSRDRKGEYADLDLPKGAEMVKSKEDKPTVDYIKVKPHPPAPPPPTAASGIMLSNYSSNAYHLHFFFWHSSIYSAQKGNHQKQAEQPPPKASEKGQKISYCSK